MQPPDQRVKHDRRPRILWRVAVWLVLATGIGVALEAVFGSLWIAVPGGLVAGYATLMSCIHVMERGRHDSIRRGPPEA